MKIVFNPSENEENRYIQLLVDGLRAAGYQVHPLDTLLSGLRHFRSVRLVHLNWFENIDERRLSVGLRSFFRKLGVLSVIRLTGKPLVWTMHNRMSHETGRFFFSRWIHRLLLRWAHVIVIHSASSETMLAVHGERVRRKAEYVPHPHFVGVYGRRRQSPHTEPNRLRLLFVGMVKPYKQLELLIDTVAAFGSDVQLTIAGRAVDEGYRRAIAARAARAGNVVLRAEFVPDDQLADLLAGADAVVLPYDLSSSLNSGSVLLAFSYAKTVICPEIGTLTDLGDRMHDTFHYRYTDEASHRDALAGQIGRALALKREDPEALDRMGERLLAHVTRTHDPKAVVRALIRIYQRLL